VKEMSFASVLAKRLIDLLFPGPSLPGKAHLQNKKQKKNEKIKIIILNNKTVQCSVNIVQDVQ